MSLADPLIFGYTAEELWPTTNIILPTWFMLVFAPRWRHTPSLTIISPLILSFLYTASVIGAMTKNSGLTIDFNSHEGVATMFKNPDVVYAGWIHYLAYDALVNRWIVLDSIERGASIGFHAFVIVPVLIFAFMCGPVGLVLYLAVVRPFFLPCKGSADASNENIKKDD